MNIIHIIMFAIITRSLNLCSHDDLVFLRLLPRAQKKSGLGKNPVRLGQKKIEIRARPPTNGSLEALIA